MNLDLLETLKQKLLTVEDLGDALAYFFDEFGDDTNFLVLGERCHDPGLETILLGTVRAMAGPEAQISDLLATRLPAPNFIHGGFTAAGKLGLFFYFPEVSTGLISLASMKTGETALARFRNSDPLPMPSLN